MSVADTSMRGRGTVTIECGRAAVAAAIAANALTRVPTWLGKRRELQALGENVWVQLEKA